MRGEIRTRRIEARTRTAAKVVERVRMPARPSHDRVPRTTRESYAVEIRIDPAKMATSFSIWVAVDKSDCGRADLLLYVPPEVNVAAKAVPITCN